MTTENSVTAPGAGEWAPPTVSNFNSLPPLAIVGIIAALGIGSGLFALFPVQVSLLIIAAVGAIALFYFIGHPSLILLALIAITATNFTDIAMQRWQLPSMSKFLFVLTLVSLGVSVARDKQKITIDPMTIVIAGCYFLAAAATVFWAYEPVSAYAGTVALFFDMLFIVILLAIVKDIQTLRALSRVFLFSLAIVAALGAIKFSLGDATLDIFGFAQILHPSLDDGYYGNRLVGPFSDPNSYGRILLLAIPFAMLEIVFGRSLLMRTTATTALCALIAALLFTKSRGALVGLFAMFGVLLIYFRAYLFRALLVIVPVCALIIMTLPDQFVTRTESMLGLVSANKARVVKHDQSIYNRLAEMLTALDMFTTHPIGGVGLDNYTQLFQKYTLDNHYVARHSARAAHSRYLEVAAEQGLIGLFAFFALCGFSLGRAFYYSRAIGRHSVREASLPLAIGLSLVGYLFASVFLHEDYSRLFFIVIGMALALPQCIKIQKLGHMSYPR